jgi:hypothetical protein
LVFNPLIAWEIVLAGAGGAALDAVAASPASQLIQSFADLSGLVKII